MRLTRGRYVASERIELRSAEHEMEFVDSIASSPDGATVLCVCESTYSESLRRGNTYPVLGVHGDKRQLRIMGESGRLGWFPSYCFGPSDQRLSMLADYSIDDDFVAGDDAFAEVEITLSTGERRWCMLATPTSLAKSGNWIDGTCIPFHYGNRHLIIARELSADLIDRILRYLDSQDELIECTLRLE